MYIWSFNRDTHLHLSPPAQYTHLCPLQAHGFAPALDALVVQSTAPLPAHQELYLNYGPHSPLKLLMLYGFLPPATNEDDGDRYAAVDVYVSIDPTTPGYRQKAQALAALGLPLFGAHSVTAAAPHIPPALLAALRIQRAATEEKEEMGTLEGAMQGPLSPANERATLGALKGALESMLDALPPPSVKEGEGLLGMVDRYLASERRVLQKALGRVTELEKGI